MWGLGLLAIVFALILFLPVKLRLRLQEPDKPAWTAELSWAGCLGAGWGEEGRYMLVGWHRWPLKVRSPRQDSEGDGERARRLWRLATAEQRRAFGRLAAATWRAASFSARGSIVYGFDDPALTAWLCGLVGALGLGADFSAKPDFTRTGWDGDLEATCSLRLAWVLWPAAALAAVYWRKNKREEAKIWQAQI